MEEGEGSALTACLSRRSPPSTHPARDPTPLPNAGKRPNADFPPTSPHGVRTTPAAAERNQRIKGQNKKGEMEEKKQNAKEILPQRP